MFKLTHREAQGYSPHSQTASADLRSCLENSMDCPPLPRRRWSVHIYLFPTIQGKYTNCIVTQYMTLAPAITAPKTKR